MMFHMSAGNVDAAMCDRLSFCVRLFAAFVHSVFDTPYCNTLTFPARRVCVVAGSVPDALHNAAASYQAIMPEV